VCRLDCNRVSSVSKRLECGCQNFMVISVFIVYSVVAVAIAVVVVAVYSIYVVGSDRAGVYFKNSAPNQSSGCSVSNQQARTVGVGQCAIRLSTDVLRGALGAVELAEGSSQTQLHARGREGALGEDADALVSLQRQALTGLVTGGAAGWDAVLALSLTKARFTGMDSMKLDREEEDMVAVF
jgi:hypothetical protein